VQQNKATSSTDTSSDIPRKARWADGRAGEDDCRIADPQTKCARLHVQTRDLQAELLFVISSGGARPDKNLCLPRQHATFVGRGSVMKATRWTTFVGAFLLSWYALKRLF